ncbi:NADPH-dependent FMN reductase [Kordiimonas aquimaris]|uniref:NADPH-dependent FMN reductase n=1 Tax=Kordiimonas aquimaris TaxID=707591 RepID=UPI0021CE56F6|nr:NADPH-dependent FMN reductase [Kordiimonas aquimaris]
MKFLAVSGSTRTASTNTALLKACAAITPPPDMIHVYSDLARLPIFSPDLEGDKTPSAVLSFCHLISKADGVIICSPEYVHAIPGGLKNAIDWLVSREEIANKPIALLHGSHRGDDMLKSLSLVLKTVSDQYSDTIFERFDVLDRTAEDIQAFMHEPENDARLQGFIDAFRQHILA